MNKKNKHIKFFILPFVFIFITSCSTKKKSWVNRQYHNTNAKYNGYFNGTQSINYGVKKIHKTHKDNYTNILPVYPIGDLKKSTKTHSYMDKAIQKGSIVIQEHSMKIKGKEYCKWIDENYLMVGKGYFYKGDFDEAITTFSFIKNEYEKNQIYFDASLWLARSFIEKNNLVAAELEIQSIVKNKKLPKRLKKELCLISAELFLKKKDFLKAKKELNKATQLIKRNKNKIRVNYILAQIYQAEKNYSLAQKYYKKVIRSNPDYEMTFNAKINLARSLEKNSSDSKKMKDKLLKMIKDDKNKEYLDQLYYAVAEMDLNIQDTNSAIKNYKSSTFYSVDNDPQKSISFLALAEIHFKKNNHKQSSLYYDSTIFYMATDYNGYNQIKERQETLYNLVKNINIIQTEDSIQNIARLPENQQKEIIKKIITDKINQEKEAVEEQRLKQQMMYESGFNQRRGEQFGNKTSGGNWYFYNPATLSFGISEFRKKWGSRKLEDDWRRKDKKTSMNFALDTNFNDSIVIQTENTKDPNYYLNQIPKTKEEFEASDNKIKSAFYELGLIYKESFGDTNSSTKNFSSIFERFPNDKEFASLALYNVFLNHKQTQNKKAKEVKKTMLKKYPNTIYTRLVNNPNYYSEILNNQDSLEMSYQKKFLLYKNKKYDQLINKTNKINNNKYKQKTQLLRALAFIRINQIENAKNILQNISKEDQKTWEESNYILESINNPSKMKKANDLAVAGSPYLYRSSSKHMIIVVLPKNNTDITYLKVLFSDFHTEKIGNEVFEISALMLNPEQHLLMIKNFQNTEETKEYYQMLIEEEKITSELKKSQHKIMAISFENFQEFYKNKDIEGYYNFFKKNYLNTN